MDHPKQSDNYRGSAGYGSAVYFGVGALRFCLYYTVAALEWPRGTLAAGKEYSTPFFPTLHTYTQRSNENHVSQLTHPFFLLLVRRLTGDVEMRYGIYGFSRYPRVGSAYF